MRQVLGILMIAAIVLLAREFTRWFKAETAKQGGDQEQAAAVSPAAPAPTGNAALPGMPASLESGYEAARKQGANALRTWLNANRPSLQDPRLGAIELEYVVMVAGKNFGEARDVFAAVRARTPTNSPLQARIRKMEPSYR